MKDSLTSTALNDAQSRPVPRQLLLHLLAVAGTTSLPSAVLVETGSLFGFKAGTIRTALSRLVADGKASYQRQTGYRLSPASSTLNNKLLALREPESRPWSGNWLMAVAPAGALSGSRRLPFLKAMRLLRTVPASGSAFLRPANLVFYDQNGEIWEPWELVRKIEPELILLEGTLQGPLATASVLPEAAILIDRMQRLRQRAPSVSPEAILTATFRIGGQAIYALHHALFWPVALLPESATEWRLLEAFREFDVFARKNWSHWLQHHGVELGSPVSGHPNHTIPRR